MLEVVCCLQHRKLLDFLVKELCIQNDRDFVRSRHTKALFEQKFVYVPILKRDEITLGTLLELTNLWTLQDLQDIMLLCKQMKWEEGIETVLKSKSCHY